MFVNEAEIATTLADAGLLTEVGSFVAINRGADKASFLVETAEGPYLVQFYERTAAAATYAVPFVAWLAGAGYPTPAPRAMQSGGWLHDGTRPSAVFPYVDGTHPPVVTASIAKQMGSTLARLHQIGDRYENPLPSIDRLRVICDAMNEARLHPLLEPWADVARMFLGANERRWLTESPALPSGPIHHDFHTDNLLFRDEAFVSVLDFDEVQQAPFVIDVARALHYIAEEAHDLRLPQATAEVFLRAYQSVRSFEQVEIHHLDLAFELANLTHVAFSILDKRDRVERLDESTRHRIYLTNRGSILPPIW